MPPIPTHRSMEIPISNGVAPPVHKRMWKVANSPVTYGILALVMSTVGGLYVWADSKSAAVVDTKITAVKEDLAGHKVDIENRVGRIEQSQYRGEQKIDWVLMRGGLGMPPGVPTAVEAKAADKLKLDGGTP